jgi:hypothetical protein
MGLFIVAMLELWKVNNLHAASHAETSLPEANSKLDPETHSAGITKNWDG